MKFNKNKRKSGKGFWNKEYKTGDHLAISNKPAEDLLKFFRWLERNNPESVPNKKTFVADLGCGNGRNLIYIANQYGSKGIGYDISEEAISQAKQLSKQENIKWVARSISGDLEIERESVDLCLDMMTSHFLKNDERIALRDNIFNILKPGGWLFFKTFLLDDDLNAKKLLKENPAQEKGSYIHPKIGVQEHVWTIKEIEDFFSPVFEIRKIEKTHRHLKKGKANKRRSVIVYMEKKW